MSDKDYINWEKNAWKRLNDGKNLSFNFVQPQFSLV